MARRKNTMNTEQKAYAIALAEFEVIKEMRYQVEKDYIKTFNLTDENGEPLKSLLDIEDEDLWEKHDATFESMLNEISWKEKWIAADKKKTAAENKLIEYGLSIVPAGVRETLKRNVHIFKIRKKLLDLAFRLDTSTVKKARA